MDWTFDYVGLWRGVGPLAGPDSVTLFGRLIGSEMRIGDTVELQTTSGGRWVGNVARFQESFQDWLALPFCIRALPEWDPFCVVINGSLPTEEFRVPGTARLANHRINTG